MAFRLDAQTSRVKMGASATQFQIMSNVHPISITNATSTRTYSVDFQTSKQYQNSWQSVLKAGYGKAEVRCGCRGSGAKRLAIKYSEDYDQFWLAKFALSGGQHAADCHFYSALSTQSGQGADCIGVVDQQSDGSVVIRLEIGLVEKSISPEPKVPVRAATNRTTSAKKSSMKLLGLLHYLWEGAGLNQWVAAFAGKRSPPSAYRRLNDAADEVWISDLKLADQLLLAAFDPERGQAVRNRERTTASFAAGLRMVIIAPLAAFSDERDASMENKLTISAFHGIPTVYMQSELWENTKRRFQNAATSWRKGAGAVAILQVELRQGKAAIYAKAIDMALMSITPEFIPVESSYERIVANLLVQQGRSFWKPLRFDANSDQVLADFILTDTSKNAPLEVFGRTDEAYLRRKEVKKAYYDKTYGPSGWWSWEAAGKSNTEGMQPFPPVR